MLTLDRAKELLATTTTEEHLFLHAKNVMAAMGGMAKHFGEDAKFILCGISMGASTVLTAAGKELPENIVGILADCGYNDAKTIIKKVIKQENGILLKPSNDKYEPFFYDKKSIEDKHVVIIGKVVELRAKF